MSVNLLEKQGGHNSSNCMSCCLSLINVSSTNDCNEVVLVLKMSSGQFRNVVRKYGVTALGTYFTISAATFWGLYFAIEKELDVKGTLQV